MNKVINAWDVRIPNTMMKRRVSVSVWRVHSGQVLSVYSVIYPRTLIWWLWSVSNAHPTLSTKWNSISVFHAHQIDQSCWTESALSAWLPKSGWKG